MKKKIKNIIGDKLNFVIYPIINLLPSKLIIGIMYYLSTGRRPNLENPKRFTEKIQLYKLNYRNPLMTEAADKYMMREYIKSKGYSNLLPKLYQVVDKFDEINFETLPNQFVIKLNNGTGTNIIVQDKRIENHKKMKREVKRWKYVNTITVGREWAYKDIKKKIIVEEYLNPKDEFQRKNGINDYKVMCFNGKAQIIWVDSGRFYNFERAFYDRDWNKLDVVSNRKSSSLEMLKPKELEKMIEISEKLSLDFPFVRVDFYLLNEKIYIGELTFYPWSGYVNFTPDEFDFDLGSLINMDFRDNY